MRQRSQVPGRRAIEMPAHTADPNTDNGAVRGNLGKPMRAVFARKQGELPALDASQNIPPAASHCFLASQAPAAQ